MATYEYVGNPDFRGWLAAQPDRTWLLGYTGNDGGFNNDKWVSENESSSLPVAQQAVKDAYAEYNNLSKQGGGGGGVGSGSGAAAPVLNQAAIDNTNKALSSLDTGLQTGYTNIDNEYNELVKGYDQEATRAGEDYTTQSNSNVNSLDRNKQNALVAAAQGRRGLRGTLASIGALSGDGITLSDRAVTEAANDDIGGAADTYATNAVGLDTAKKNFEEEDELRRKRAQVQKQNQRTALEGQTLAERQKLLRDMADVYKEGGRNDEYTRYLNQAGDLSNSIQQKKAVVATPFEKGKAAFTPGTLESYLAGAGNMTVEVAGGGPGAANPQTVLAGRGRARRRDEEELAV